MWTCSERRRQRGDVLLEALIGVLLTCIIGGGMAHVAARLGSSQRDAKIENLVVERLRAELHAGGRTLCNGDATRELTLVADVKVVNADVECKSAAVVSITAGGETANIDAPGEVSLSVSSAALDVAGGDAEAPALIVATRQ